MAKKTKVPASNPAVDAIAAVSHSEIRTPKWVKNPEGIAALMGLVLPKNRKKKLKLLADVRALTTAAGPGFHGDFPPKDPQKGYWPRQPVVDWLAKNIVVAKNHKLFALVECGAGSAESGIGQKSESDLPAQAKPAEGELFQEISAAEKFAARLRFNLDIYLNPHLHPTPSGGVQKLRGDEIQELRTAGLLPKVTVEDGADGRGVNIGGGVRGVAGYINNNFDGVKVSHQSIHNWCKGVTLPPGCRENFPPPDAKGSNRWKKAEIDVWVIRYLKPSGREQGLVMVDDRSRKEKADADMAVMESELMRQRVSTKYMESKMVEGFIEGFGNWLALQQDKFIEDRGTNCVRAIVREAIVAVLPSVTPEQLVVLDSRLAPALASANDAMKLAAGHHAGDLLVQLKKERAEQVREAQQA